MFTAALGSAAGSGLGGVPALLCWRPSWTWPCLVLPGSCAGGDTPGQCRAPTRPATCCGPRTSPTAGTLSRSASPCWPLPRDCRAPISAASSAGHSGRAPHRYLLTRRLERAAALLRNTDRTVADICLMAGFTSVGSFTTSFGRTFGLSPTAYRSACPPAAARARIPDCLLRAWGLPHLQTARLEKTGRDGPP